MRMPVGDWVAASGLSASEVARRAGVARSTLQRIERGQVSPTLATLEEIAIACGRGLEVGSGLLSDPLAGEAARALLESGYRPSDPEGVERWKARLRHVAGDDPVGIVSAAGRMASVRDREGARFLRGVAPPPKVASAGDAAGGSWALSGGPALAVPGTTVLWTVNAATAGRLLAESMRDVPDASVADVIVAPADEALFAGSWREGPLTFVAPIQALLDAFGLEENLRREALVEARSW